MESFFAYVKKNRNTEIWLWFQDDISEAYLNRLQEIVDEIISTENREYRAPWIYFDAITEDSNDNLYALFEQDCLIFHPSVKFFLIFI
uniref:Uncharacterized protein n=1 Tax=Panagrolaimus sp. PS1159 TaxID=55785 RepID=A0AC35EX39_9BILA